LLKGAFFAGVFLTAFQSVVWPAAIADLAGFDNKAFVFAACGQVAVVMSWLAPTSATLGACTDRLLPGWVAQRFGRRRPFIVAGRIFSLAGNLLLYVALVALETPSIPLLAAGLVVMNLGGSLASPAFNAILPDTVPLEQRAACLTTVTWTASVCTLLGFGVGWLLGEGVVFTDTLLWRINVAMWAVDLPILLIACNAEAGCWMPEYLPKGGTAAAAAAPPASPAAARTASAGLSDEVKTVF
jgi:MFS family permease